MALGEPQGGARVGVGEEESSVGEEEEDVLELEPLDLPCLRCLRGSGTGVDRSRSRSPPLPPLSPSTGPAPALMSAWAKSALAPESPAEARAARRDETAASADVEEM
jgi:hypothetical protein